MSNPLQDTLQSIYRRNFDETANFIIGDGEVILKNYNNYNITDAQFVLLKNFCDEFEAFSDEHNWPQEFIDTPEWTKITEMAKEVLSSTLYIF